MTTPLIKLIRNTLPKAFAAAGNANPSEEATLIRTTLGDRSPGSLLDGRTQTDTSYPCKGFVSSEKHATIGETTVEQTDRVVCLLGGTLATRPKSGDRITIDSLTQRVVDLEGSDALWTCLCRS